MMPVIHRNGAAGDPFRPAARYNPGHRRGGGQTMGTIETTAVVPPEHTLTVELPADIPPGPHRVVLVIESGVPKAVFPWKDWKPHDVGLVDPNFTFRREDLYGDDGR